MILMPRPTKNYILLVDTYRRPSRRRNTAGRYRVGARDKKEAIALLRKAIGFGAIQVYYEVEDPKNRKNGRPERDLPMLERGVVMREEFPIRLCGPEETPGVAKWQYVEPKHASAKQSEE
jgi:hypothetical protein